MSEFPEKVAIGLGIELRTAAGSSVAVFESTDVPGAMGFRFVTPHGVQTCFSVGEEAIDKLLVLIGVHRNGAVLPVESRLCCLIGEPPQLEYLEERP